MRFDLLEPTSFPHAVDLLHQYGHEVRPLAGGTDLFVQLKDRNLRVGFLLSLSHIPGLDKIVYQPGRGITIGPLVTHSQVAGHPIIYERFTALSLAAASVGSPQIRNLGTVVGNLGNASPAADTASALLALRARLILFGPEGERCLDLEEFFRGPGQTALLPGELIKEIFIPEMAPGTLSTYLKLGQRRAMEISICGVALAAYPEDGCWRSSRVGLGSVAPTPLLAFQTSALLEDRPWEENLSEKAAETASAECSPIDDLRASRAYRLDMVRVLIKRAIKDLLSRGESGSRG